MRADAPDRHMASRDGPDSAANILKKILSSFYQYSISCSHSKMWMKHSCVIKLVAVQSRHLKADTSHGLLERSFQGIERPNVKWMEHT